MNIAWASGIYEGEGSLKKDKRKLATFELKIKMTDYDVVRQLQKVWGVGSVRDVKVPPNCKDAWIWSVCNKADIHYILTSMLPFLGERRTYDALNCIDDIDFSYNKDIA